MSNAIQIEQNSAVIAVDDFYTIHDVDEEVLVPLTPQKSFKNLGPGGVRTKGTFTVHTKAAHRLFFGRKKTKGVEPIVGLVQFSSKVNLIYSAAEYDDPYADKRLFDIEQAIQKANSIITTNDLMLDELLGQNEQIKICPSLSIEPKSLVIEFKTPYGYLGVQLLSSFDQLLLKALAARHAALIFDDDWKQFINYAARKIRHVFSMTDSYRYTGIVRKDFLEKNQKAKSAIEKFGVLSPEILSGTLRGKYAPKIQASR